MLLGNSNKLFDAILGRWQLSGIGRWSSGLPFSLFEPGWTTDWQIESYGDVTAPVKMHRHLDANGNPQYFADPSSINNGIPNGTPVRLPYPGDAGQRDNFAAMATSTRTRVWQRHGRSANSVHLSLRGKSTT